MPPLTPAQRSALAAAVERAYRAAYGAREDAWSPARVAAWCAEQAPSGEPGEDVPAVWCDALAWDAHGRGEWERSMDQGGA